MRFSQFIRSDIEKVLDQCNLTEDEEMIFNALTRNKSIVEISIETGMSTATVSRRIKDIKTKIDRIKVGDYF